MEVFFCHDIIMDIFSLFRNLFFVIISGSLHLCDEFAGTNAVFVPETKRFQIQNPTRIYGIYIQCIKKFYINVHLK